MPGKSRWPDRPAFLEGCFQWDRRGYAYSLPPPLDLMKEQALEDPDSWIVLASVLEHAKNGDFRHIHRLHAEALDESGDPTLGGACLDLIADAGSRADLEFLAEMVISEDVPGTMRSEACFPLSYCGELWLVEYMLECWKSLKRHADRELVDTAIRQILEPEGVASTLDEINWFEAPEEYEAQVLARYQELVEQAGSDETSFFFGVPLDVETLVRSMRQMVETNDTGGILSQWRRFEPLTGVDCSSFTLGPPPRRGTYKPGGVRNLSAVAGVLNRFERSSSASRRFEPGRRYFFGHLVPR